MYIVDPILLLSYLVKNNMDCFSVLCKLAIKWYRSNAHMCQLTVSLKVKLTDFSFSIVTASRTRFEAFQYHAFW